MILTIRLPACGRRMSYGVRLPIESESLSHLLQESESD